MSEPRREWTLRQRVTALCLLVGAMLIVLAVTATALAAANRAHLDTLINTSGPLRVAAERLMAAVVEQEAGIRGYAATADPADMAPYADGIAHEEQVAAEMAALFGDRPALREQLQAVRVEAARWRQQVAMPVMEAVRTKGTGAAQPLLGEEARRSFEAVRASVTALQATLLKEREEVAAAARSTSDGVVLMMICAALVVLFAGAATLGLLHRMVTRPVTELAEQVRAVASGDYDREISSSGPPELARLAASVDAMRRQIAADLSAVREARGQIEWVNEQLQVQAAELTRSNRDLEQFAYVASHDLQEPLRKVVSFCQLLQRRYAGQLDERADQYIAFAVAGAQRMQRLINDLLAFSRIGRLTSGFTDVALDRVLAEVSAQSQGARESSDAQITWTDLPVVEGEESLLTTLFTNLVGNSLKFRRPGVAPRVHVSARRLDGDWEITVEDNGIGIEKEFAEKIFVIFQRLHPREAYAGTGIGLAIVKKIVEYHGGRIWLDPDMVEGTRIRFTLSGAPVLAGSPVPEQVADEPPAASPERHSPNERSEAIA